LREPIVTEVRSLHGTTVAEIFSAGLDNLEKIEAVAVSVLWKDGTVTAGCSNTTKANLALLVLAVDEHQRRGFSDSG
jgi:hypothetical protein